MGASGEEAEECPVCGLPEDVEHIECEDAQQIEPYGGTHGEVVEEQAGGEGSGTES